MENQSKQSTTEDYKTEIERWAQEDVLQLANHFHKLNINNNQFERTSYFTMNSDDVKTFQAMKESITDLRIYMALREQNKEEHTFFPVLRVTDTKENHTYLELISGDEVGIQNSIKSEFVPELFKNIISKNWDTIDINLIDDLFTARKIEDTEFEVTVRVKYFKICEEIIDVIKEIKLINGITLYSGIDMNKFPDKYQISFTPVLGFRHEKQDTDDLTFGLKNIMELSKGEVFVEYTSPCPPTC